MFKVKDDNQEFIKGKCFPIAEFIDAEWIRNLAFLVDLTSHLNELIKPTCLPGQGQLTNCLFERANAFLVKSSLGKTNEPPKSYPFSYFIKL